MLIKHIDMLCTEEQKKLYYDKAIKCEVTICYAQTEVGHGSDIQNL